MNLHISEWLALAVIALANVIQTAVGLQILRIHRDSLEYIKTRDFRDDVRRSKEQPKYIMLAKLDDPEGIISKTIPDPPPAPEQPGEPWTK